MQQQQQVPQYQLNNLPNGLQQPNSFNINQNNLNQPQQTSLQPQQQQQQFAQPGIYNPMQPVLNNISPAPFYNSGQTNSIRPPPTASEINAQKQANLTQTNTNIQTMPPTGSTAPISSSNSLQQQQQTNLTNQFNNLNISQKQPQFQPQIQSQVQPQLQKLPTQSSQSQQPPPPHFVTQSSRQQANVLNSSTGAKMLTNKSLPNSVDLMREKRLISEYSHLEEPIRPQFPHEFYTNVNCHPEFVYFYFNYIFID